MTGSERLPLMVALLVAGCGVSRSPNNPAPQAKSDSETEEPSSGAASRSAAWRDLVDLHVRFDAPLPMDLSELPEPPAALPQSADGPRMEIDVGPFVHWPDNGTGCLYASPYVPTACARIEEDIQGRVSRLSRMEHADGGPAVVAIWEYGELHAMHFDRCWYDSVGRVTKRQLQRTRLKPRATSCLGWTFTTIHEGYDELGGFIFSEERTENNLKPGASPRSVDYGAVIYQPTYEQGRITRMVKYEMGVDYLELSEVCDYVWEASVVARIDCYNSSGEWHRSKVFTWSGEFVRDDSVSAPLQDAAYIEHAGTIHHRRGPGDYVTLYWTPDKHWDYEVSEGVETVTKYVDDFVVERRRFSVVGGERRPLTVEQRLPDVEGLVTVEAWQWDVEDRVTVVRHDGRDTYMLDCSELPTIDSLVEAGCPPPRPIR